MKVCRICGKKVFFLAEAVSFNDGTCLCNASCMQRYQAELQVPEIPMGRCSICGKKRISEVGVQVQQIYKVCKKCNLILHTYVLTPNHATFPEVLQQYYDALLPLNSGFTVTNKVNDFLFIDKNHSQWFVPDTTYSIPPKRASLEDIHSFQEVLRYELIEDENIIIVTSHKGAVGRAIVGGIIAGSTGAVIGAVTSKKESNVNTYCMSMKIRVYLDNGKKPYTDILISSDKILRESTEYKEALDMAYACMQCFDDFL